jgi:hypothetical protein
MMNAEAESITKNTSTALRTLIRGLTQDNLREIYAGHKTLCKIGAPSVRCIQEAIHKSGWTKVKYSNEIRYLTGLVSILHDIDETMSRWTADLLKKGGCDPSVSRLLDSVCSFTIADYIQYEILGVRIFEHQNLEVRQPVRPKLEQWLNNVPEGDLKEVERIYILRRGDLNTLGTYTPILCNINLVWDNPYPRFNLISYFNLYTIENTLYHEIGHHTYRHTFGQDEQQEKEANNYADWMMAAKSNHMHFRMMRGIFGSLPHPFEKRKASS